MFHPHPNTAQTHINSTFHLVLISKWSLEMLSLIFHQSSFLYLVQTVHDYSTEVWHELCTLRRWRCNFSWPLTHQSSSYLSLGLQSKKIAVVIKTSCASHSWLQGHFTRNTCSAWLMSHLYQIVNFLRDPWRWPFMNWMKLCFCRCCVKRGTGMFELLMVG